MTALTAVPPPFLLPAWSRVQLRLLSADIQRTTRHRHIHQQRAIGTTISAASNTKDAPDVYGTIQTQDGPRVVLTYASRRENRYQRGLDQIKERLLRKKRPERVLANYNLAQAEKRLEEQTIASFYERKRQAEQPLRQDDIQILGVNSKPISEPVNNDQQPRLKRTPIPHEGHVQVKKASRKLLLEELFPEEAAKLQKAANTSEQRQSQIEAPLLPLPTVESIQQQTTLPKQKPLPRSVSITSEVSLRQIPSLLKLENALPNLIEADFRRMSEKGAHIEGWGSAGDPIAIVPVRIDSTTQSTGTYYLVFQTMVHAKAWRTRIQHLHSIVSHHTNNSLYGEIVPPSGFKSGGEDVGKLLKEYSIFSPDVVPKMTFYSNAEPNLSIQHDLDMIAARLQPSIRGLQPGRSVVLWIDGWTLGTFDIIKQMIVADGKQRHLVWGDPANKYLIQNYIEESTKSSEDDNSGPRGKARAHQQRWMVTLRDQAEARRFVRAWHRRPFPEWAQHKKDDIDEPWPLVKAELLL